MANYEVFGSDKKVFNYYIGYSDEITRESYLINVTDYIEKYITFFSVVETCL